MVIRMLIALLLIPALAFSQGDPLQESADSTVQAGVEQVLAVVVKYANEDGSVDNYDEFSKEMEELLDPVIFFNLIASRVMGDHYKLASSEQKKRFFATFRKSMIDTYAGGLLGFGGFKVVVVPSKDDKKNTYKNTRVYLDVVSPGGKKYPMVQSLVYSKKSDAWKMQNMEFNGINLGLMFKSQFAQIIDEANGDIDQAVTTWEQNTLEKYQNTQFRERESSDS